MLGRGEVFDSLISFEMIFDEMDFTLGVDPLEGVRAVAVHVSVTIWSSSV